MPGSDVCVGCAVLEGVGEREGEDVGDARRLSDAEGVVVPVAELDGVRESDVEGDADVVLVVDAPAVFVVDGVGEFEAEGRGTKEGVGEGVGERELQGWP